MHEFLSYLPGPNPFGGLNPTLLCEMQNEQNGQHEQNEQHEQQQLVFLHVNIFAIRAIPLGKCWHMARRPRC